MLQHYTTLLKAVSACSLIGLSTAFAIVTIHHIMAFMLVKTVHRPFPAFLSHGWDLRWSLLALTSGLTLFNNSALCLAASPTNSNTL